MDLRRACLPRTVPSAVATDGEGKKKSSITIRSIKSKLYSWGMRMERAKVHGQLFRVSIITKQVQATCMDPTHTGICVCKMIPCIIRSLQGGKNSLLGGQTGSLCGIAKSVSIIWRTSLSPIFPITGPASGFRTWYSNSHKGKKIFMA